MFQNTDRIIVKRCISMEYSDRVPDSNDIKVPSNIYTKAPCGSSVSVRIIISNQSTVVYDVTNLN